MALIPKHQLRNKLHISVNRGRKSNENSHIPYCLGSSNTTGLPLFPNLTYESDFFSQNMTIFLIHLFNSQYSARYLWKKLFNVFISSAASSATSADARIWLHKWDHCSRIRHQFLLPEHFLSQNITIFLIQQFSSQSHNPCNLSPDFSAGATILLRQFITNGRKQHAVTSSGYWLPPRVLTSTFGRMRRREPSSSRFPIL